MAQIDVDIRKTGGNPQGGVDRFFQIARFSGFAMLALVVLVANVVLFRQIDTQFERSNGEKIELSTWELAQLEVTYLQTVTALQKGFGDLGAQNEARTAFSALQAQVARLADVQPASGLSFWTSDLWADLSAEDTGLVARLGAALAGEDRAALSAVLRDAEALQPALREATRAAAQDAMNIVEDNRDAFRTSLQVFTAMALGLLGVKSALIIMTYLQSRLRERQRQELTQAVFNLRTTIDSSLDAAVIFDHDGRVIGCNRIGAAMFDWQENSPIVRYFTDVVRAPLGLQDIAYACASAGNEMQGRITVMGRRASGESYPMEISVALARSADDMPISVAFIRDISALVEREESLRQARNEALEGQESKSRFLAMMGHEMRTPLNGLLSAIEMLREASELSEKNYRLVEIIDNCGRATLEQVNNVLDITSLSGVNAQNFPVTVFDLRAMLESLAAQFESEAYKRGNRLQIRMSGITPPPFVVGQRPLVLRVMHNLISNAVKFTENGVIILSVDCQAGRQVGTLAVRLAVSDTGVGIPEGDRDRIFNAFETLDSSYTRLREGSGLGLGLAKLAAEALGGRITVSSRQGQGSTFSLFITLPEAEDEADHTAPKAAFDAMPLPPLLKSLKVLVVEDNPVNRELLVERLRMKGHQVAYAVNGQEGVNRAHEYQYDAILMDISMPVKDGLTATKEIRAGDGLSKNTPIIAITANADRAQQRGFLSAGMNEVFTKPVDMALLVRALSAYALPQSADIETFDSGSDISEVVSENQYDHLVDDAVLSDLEEALGTEYTRKMLARFVVEAKETLDEIDACTLRSDCHAAAAAAHKNAGAAAAIGLTAMHRLLVAFEKAAKDSDIEAAMDLRARLAPLKDASLAALVVRNPEAYTL